MYLPTLRTTALRACPTPPTMTSNPTALSAGTPLTLTRNVIGPVIGSLAPAVLRRGRGVFGTIDQDAALTRRIETTGVLARSARDLAGAVRFPGIDRRSIGGAETAQLEFPRGVAAARTRRRAPAGNRRTGDLARRGDRSVAAPHRRSGDRPCLRATAEAAQRRRRRIASWVFWISRQAAARFGDRRFGRIHSGAGMGQATTAAVLRSAYLRHKADGAFEIDLSSRRVRGALALLDVLKKGLPLEEALGLRGERWLHDNRLSRLTFDLRRVFPFVNVTPPKSAPATRKRSRRRSACSTG